MKPLTLAVFLIVGVSSAFGQGTGDVSGSVTDASGAFIPGVTVKLTNASISVSRSTVTNATGAYGFNTLQPGEDAIYNAKRALAAFNYVTDPARSKYLLDDTDYDMKVRVFERDAIGLIGADPGVTFDIYLPPYSILQWVALRDTSPETLKSVYAFSAYFCRRLMEFPNVRLFDFRALKEVTHDLNNYSDVIHHSPDIDLRVLSWLAEGKYRVDRTQPTFYLDQLKAQVEAYRLERVEH